MRSIRAIEHSDVCILVVDAMVLSQDQEFSISQIEITRE